MNALTQPAALAASHLNINLTDFIDEFGDELLESLNRSNPPVYTGSVNAHRHSSASPSRPRPRSSRPSPPCCWTVTSRPESSTPRWAPGKA